MARKRTRRYSRRYRGRWSSNIRTLSVENQSIPANSSFYTAIKLCENPAQNDNTVSQQFTVKNLEYSYNFGATNPDTIENVQSYIMFVPQGYAVSETLPFTHPEWIMANRYLGDPMQDVSDRFLAKIKSRLARRLNTGDAIYFLLVGESGNNSHAATLKGLARWWTKAN